MSKTFTAIIIIVNMLFSLLFFQSSEPIFTALSNGQIISKVDIFFITTVDTRGLAVTYLNGPFFFLLFSLIINVCFLILLRSKK